MPQANLDFNAKDNTRNVFRRIFNRLKNLTAKIFTLRAAMAAFGVFMAGRLASQTLKYNDAIGKVADSVKISTEFLQKFRFAGAQTGVTIQQVDVATQKFSRAMGDLRAGTGSLFTLLKDTDPQFIKMLENTKGNEQAMRAFVNELGRYKRVQDQSTLATAAFGRAGGKMVVLFKDGTLQLDKFGQKAESIGAILRDKVIRNSEATNDALNRMSKVLRVIFANVLDNASKSIQRFTEFIIRNRKAIEAFFNSMINGARNVKNAFAGVSKFIRLAQVELIVASGRFEKLVITDLPKVRIELQKAADVLKNMSATGFFRSDKNDFARQIKQVENLKNTFEKLQALQAKNNFKMQLAQQISDRAEQIAQDAIDAQRLTKIKVLHNKELVLEQERIRDIINAKLIGIDQATATELERLEAALDRRFATLEQAEELGIIKSFQAKERKEALEELHQERLTEIARSGAFKRRDLEKFTDAQRFQSAIGTFRRITSSAAQHSRALFNLNKIAAISETVVNTRAAAMKVWKQWGWPLGAVFAGLTVAAGAAQIAGIKKQQFSASGSVSGGGAGGGAISSPQDLGSSIDVPRGPTQIILALPDDTEVVSKAWIRNSLLPAINEELADGAEFIA